MLINKYRYIVVEGPVGVGKTSLAQRLAEQLGSTVLLEKPLDNPFLKRFYQDPARYALPSQLFFLMQRTKEMQALVQMKKQGGVVTDYLFEKDPLFANLNLNDEEYELYQSIYQSVAPQTLKPDLVIYLQAGADTLIGRVRKRANAYERTITDDYLKRLAQAYSDLFYHYNAAPVLVVNSEHLNFAEKEEDFSLLLQRIEQMRGTREFFSKG